MGTLPDHIWWPGTMVYGHRGELGKGVRMEGIRFQIENWEWTRGKEHEACIMELEQTCGDWGTGKQGISRLYEASCLYRGKLFEPRVKES